MSKIKNIVVIDDNKIDCFINKKIISVVNNSIGVKLFNSATDALEFFNTISIENKTNPILTTDIILLDINMPVMNGFEFLIALSKIKTFLKNPIEVYFLSSSINEKDINDALNIEYCSGYIIKPLTKEKILEILEFKSSTKQKIIA